MRYAILALGSAPSLAAAGALLGTQSNVKNYGVVGLHIEFSAPALLTLALPLASLAYGLFGPGPAAVFPVRKSGALVGMWGVLGALVLAGVVGGALFFSRGHLEVKVNAEQVVNGLPAANCAAGDYPSINISNTGEDPIEWQLSTDTRDVVLFSSSQGSLQPGESIIIRLLGNFSGSQVTVTVHSGAGSESVTIVCT